MAGRSPLGEAEFAGWEEGAQWLLGQMTLDDVGSTAAEKEEQADEDELEPEVGGIEVEIQDAEGGVAKMSIGRPQDK